MRCVLDTNVLVSAFLWQGLPARLTELASENEVRLFTSRALLDELDEVLHRKKLAKAVRLTGFSADQLVSHYRRLAYRVTARQLTSRISRDPDDDQVRACSQGRPHRHRRPGPAYAQELSGNPDRDTVRGGASHQQAIIKLIR